MGEVKHGSLALGYPSPCPFFACSCHTTATLKLLSFNACACSRCDHPTPRDLLSDYLAGLSDRLPGSQTPSAQSIRTDELPHLRFAFISRRRAARIRCQHYVTGGERTNSLACYCSATAVRLLPAGLAVATCYSHHRYEGPTAAARRRQ